MAKKINNNSESEVTIYKLKKILKWMSIIAVIVLLIEGILFLVLKEKYKDTNVYYEGFLDLAVLDDNSKVVVGSSYFNNSKKYEFDGYLKGLLIKYDDTLKNVLEVQYDRGHNSEFTSINLVDDGYIVTGSCEFTDYQTENNIRTALLIKYDFDGNKVWEKTYEVRSDTRFNDALITSDGVVVIGKSIYEAMELGNHTDGGGIIVKYDFDGNEVWHNNLGGNKSGNFNAIIEVKGDFYVVGKDASDFGNIVKFDNNGKYVWHKNYSYTDSLGFMELTYYDNNLYVVGSKKILDNNENIEESVNNRNTENTDLLILKYNMNGKLIKEYTYGGSSYERGVDIEFIDDNFYIIGSSSSKDAVIPIDKEPKFSSGIVLKYNKNFEYIDGISIGGSDNDVLTNIYNYNNNFYLSGYSNSCDGNVKTKDCNGKDYFGKIYRISKDLKFDVIK